MVHIILIRTAQKIILAPIRHVITFSSENIISCWWFYLTFPMTSTKLYPMSKHVPLLQNNVGIFNSLRGLLNFSCFPPVFFFLMYWNKYSCLLSFRLKGSPIRWFDPHHIYVGHLSFRFQCGTPRSLSFFLNFISNTPSHVQSLLFGWHVAIFFFNRTLAGLISQKHHFYISVDCPFRDTAFVPLELTHFDNFWTFLLDNLGPFFKIL